MSFRRVWLNVAQRKMHSLTCNNKRLQLNSWSFLYSVSDQRAYVTDRYLELHFLHRNGQLPVMKLSLMCRTFACSYLCLWESTVCWSIHGNLLFLTASDSLIQQTGCDLVTPGCQGESGGAMAVGATVGESQLQRIIRDLHGTSALCVRAILCECVWIDWLRAVVSWHGVTEEKRKKS